ncbi:hypothetical protein GA0115252_11931 [Streptomyces sp. DfronAA-171]|nr:hypothetical protein GA0115252_11931 [Streptomyces sp. DfronAA-171]
MVRRGAPVSRVGAVVDGEGPYDAGALDARLLAHLAQHGRAQLLAALHTPSGDLRTGLRHTDVIEHQQLGPTRPVPHDIGRHPHPGRKRGIHGGIVDTPEGLVPQQRGNSG